MKNVFSILGFLFVINLGFAQIVVIPDSNFKNRLINFPCIDTDDDGFGDSDADLNNDGEIQVSEAESVTRIIIGSGANITSVEGIQAFTNLVKLQFSGNDITQLPIDNLINLVEVICFDTQITSLNVSNLVNLEFLQCEENEITSLIVNGAINLDNLDCAANQISNLEVDQLENLVTLNSYDNNLTSLDVSGLSNLRYLYTSNNNLTSINTQDATSIEYFNVSLNQLTSIETSHLPNLYFFGCAFNPLGMLSFGASNENIVQLNCRDSNLTSLEISSLPNLELLDAGYNNLTSIDVSNQENLLELSVRNNLLEQIFIKNGADNSQLMAGNNVFPFINNPTLQYVCIDESEREFMEWRFGLSDFENVVINTYCSFEPGGRNFSVFGETKIDIDINGCDDVDPNFIGSNFNISQNNISLGTISSNSLGIHDIPFSEGSYTITPLLENSDYFTISPSNISVTFPDDGSLYLQDFCLIPSGTYNDLEVFIVPITDAVPGFDSEYKILYRNKGNTMLSGTIDFSFEDDYIDFLSANPAETMASIGSLQWNYTDLQPLEEREIDLSFNLNTPMDSGFPLNGGDILEFDVNITPYLNDEVQADNSFGLKQTVVNSFDPNDIRCLEGITIVPEHVGEYVHYIIRFENSGTSNAVNVVVKDVFDEAKFDVFSLIPLRSSHNYTTRITEGNIVEFIFENIQLPFDDANNDGYIIFKVKTLETLQLGDTFENEAEIYFDFNFPIITNNYLTTVARDNLSVDDFEFGNVRLFPNPAKDVLTILSTLMLDKIKIFDINGRLILSQTLDQLTSENAINVKDLTSGAYFLEAQADERTKVLKFIKQ